MRIEQVGFDEWEEQLPNSGFEVFHLPDALSVLEAHADADCRLYAAKKGQETVGLLPVFVEERRVGRMVLSPPPGFSIPRLGPLVMPNSPKSRKREQINQALIGEVLDAVDADASTTLVRILSPLDYTDPRPFSWSGLDLQPKFTYVVDAGEVATLDELMAGFSKSLRNKMRRLEDLDLHIGDERRTGALRIHEDLAARYLEQDETPPTSRRFVEDVVDALDDRYRAYVARDDTGAYRGGILVLYSNDKAYFWQGGARHSYDGISVNTLLHRRILEDILSDPELDSITQYDLVGANTERLCEYKAKFCGDLSEYYVAESSGVGMKTAKTAYRMVSNSFSKS